MNGYEKTAPDLAKELASDLEYGLGVRQAEKLLEEHGPNRLSERKKTTLIIRFFSQFNDFMILILLAAAGVSFWISLMNGEKDFLDPLIILCIVVVNAVLGLAQEYKAEKSIEALKKLSTPTAKVIRDGRLSCISSEKLVPGDLILLETGDYVPADARIVRCSNLKLEESALTGESLPVEKDADYISLADSNLGDRINMAYSGSAVCSGHGMAMVTHTGMDTEVGKIANILLTGDSPETPLQRKLAETGKILGIGALCICGIIFLLGLMRNIPIAQMFMTSVSLAVAAMPEGLPAVVTVTLAIGVQRMSGRKAIIRKLPAVETLGSTNVICSDKTGTLTQNKMTVVEVSSSKERLLELAALCNDVSLDPDTKSVLGDPTEAALVLAALNMNLDKNVLEQKLPRIGDAPFESKRKLMSTVHKSADGKFLVITKGAPDALLKKCSRFEDGEIVSLSPNKERDLLKLNKEMADKALRVLGVAYKELETAPYKYTEDVLEHDLIFVGLIGMMDPPKDEAKAAVATCRLAGIKPVMVTGDHSATAAAIAKKVGILTPGDRTMTGDELSGMSQEALNKRILEYSVFARVTPEHKVRIVKAFQSTGAVVAMTGDGVNDAPALKAADIGCAMGISGTEVAKSAADMVLMDDNFATIVEAVREGRGIYANVRKAVHFLLSSNIGEIATILAALLMGWGSPLLAIHLLWVNLVTDSLPAIALGVDPTDKDVMRQKPHSGGSKLFNRELWQQIGLEGIMIGTLSLLAFAIGTTFAGNAAGQTMAFATLSISQLVHAFNMRSDKSLFTINPFDNKHLNSAFLIGVLLQVFVITFKPLAAIFQVVPLTAAQWLLVIGLCAMPIAVVETEKFARGISLGKKGNHLYKTAGHPTNS